MYRFAVGLRSYGNRFRKIELPSATESRKNVFVCGEILKVLLKKRTVQFYGLSTSNPSTSYSEKYSEFKKLTKEQKNRVTMKFDSACEQQIAGFENDFGFEIKKVTNGKFSREGSLRIRIHYLDNNIPNNNNFVIVTN